MKKMIYLLLLTVLPSSIILADHVQNHLEGLWFARSGHHDLHIKSRSYGLKIRGLNGDRKWRKMRHTPTHNVFIDRNGNAVEIINRNHIVYLERPFNNHHRSRSHRYQDHRNVTHYVRGDSHYISSCVDDRYYLDGSYSEEREDRYYTSPNRYYYRDRGFRKNDEPDYLERSSGGDSDRYLNDIIGSWKSRTPDKKVYIKKNENGIKARFAGSSKWSFYYRDKKDMRSFTDRKGNSYRLKSKNTLEWISHDNRKINLEKE